MERTNHENVGFPTRAWTSDVNNHRSKTDPRACKVYQRRHRQASEHLRRAERDLAEAAAFIAGSLTTITAIQAVITIAKTDLGLSTEFLQLAFQGYLIILILILVLGGLRASDAIRRRTRAESDIDLTKEGMIEFCETDQMPASETKE